MRRLALSFVTLALLASGQTASATQPVRYAEYVGALHNHSGYSDGWPGTIPADYYASGKHFGLDFLSGSEHSDTAAVPVTASDGCLGELITQCVAYDGVNSLRKWDATLEQAHAATDANFTGIRGFEWTSDRYGHINVYFSKNDTNAKIDGGYVSMDTFYNWFTRDPSLLGGSDGLATFNHPGGKSLEGQTNIDGIDRESINWNDFAYVPAADDRMVGIELFNDFDEYDRYYAHALDKGWHIGAVGAEDLHGIPDSDGRNEQGGPQWAKTVILANDRSETSLKDAMHARHFYAIRDNRGPRLQLSFTVNKAVMGSRLTVRTNKDLAIHARTNRPDAVVDVITSGGAVVASGLGEVDVTLPATGSQRYYFMRVRSGASPIGYSSPVWIN